jgi:hypothetical protein
MEDEVHKLREILSGLFEGLQRTEHELLACQTTLLLLKFSGEFPEIDQFLKKARETSYPALEKRHAEIRASIQKAINAAQLEQVLQQFLRDWKPTGPAH